MAYLKQIPGLRPTEEDHARINGIRDEIMGALMKVEPTKNIVAGYVFGGSVGKSTFRRNRNELDLLVQIKQFDLSKHKKQEYLDAFEKVLKTLEGLVVTGHQDRTKRKSLKLTWKSGQWQGMKADVLAIGPLKRGGLDFLDMTAEDAEWSSGAAVVLGRSFFIDQVSPFQDMVRASKAWRDSKKWTKRRPKSFLLEVIMAEVVQRVAVQTLRMDESHQWSTVFRAFLRRVISMSDQSHKTLMFKNKTPVPRVLISDPGNPAINVADCMHDQWSELVDYAKETLKSIKTFRFDDCALESHKSEECKH